MILFHLTCTNFRSIWLDLSSNILFMVRTICVGRYIWRDPKYQFLSSVLTPTDTFPDWTRRTTKSLTRVWGPQKILSCLSTILCRTLVSCCLHYSTIALVDRVSVSCPCPWFFSAYVVHSYIVAWERLSTSKTRIEMSSLPPWPCSFTQPLRSQRCAH